MALKRYRAARYPDRYVVLDHGEPDADGVYHQDGDPADPGTKTSVVFEANGDSPEDKWAAQSEAARLNAVGG